MTASTQCQDQNGLTVEEFVPDISQKANYFIIFLQGQVPLQEAFSLEEPEHEAPPFLGVGLLHCLVLFFFPDWALHELQDPQELHAPFTKKD